MGHTPPLIIKVREYTNNGIDIGYKLAIDAADYITENRKRGGRVILDFEGVTKFSGHSAYAFYSLLCTEIETYTPMDYISFDNRCPEVVKNMQEVEEQYNAAHAVDHQETTGKTIPHP